MLGNEIHSLLNQMFLFLLVSLCCQALKRTTHQLRLDTLPPRTSSASSTATSGTHTTSTTSANRVNYAAVLKSLVGGIGGRKRPGSSRAQRREETASQLAATNPLQLLQADAAQQAAYLRAKQFCDAAEQEQDEEDADKEEDVPVHSLRGPAVAAAVPQSELTWLRAPVLARKPRRCSAPTKLRWVDQAAQPQPLYAVCTIAADDDETPFVKEAEEMEDIAENFALGVPMGGGDPDILAMATAAAAAAQHDFYSTVAADDGVLFTVEDVPMDAIEPSDLGMASTCRMATASTGSNGWTDGYCAVLSTAEHASASGDSGTF